MSKQAQRNAPQKGASMKQMRVAMPAWEIGRVQSGLGTKVGGLGVIVEELPPELVKAAVKQHIDLEVVTLSPCFAHYDRSSLTKLDLNIPAMLEGHHFEYELYEHVFPDGQKVVYFWDEWQLSWTSASAVYPSDPQMSLRLYASMSQAMAGYIKAAKFDSVHLHDYHVGLIPFYLGDDYLNKVPVHFTIHNATHQGIMPLTGGGYSSLDRIHLSGEQLFHKYFDFFDNLNLMKACMLKVHESGGKITTVSGDIEGTWGYAAELKESHEQLRNKAALQKGSAAVDVFVPNGCLDLFEKLPIAGITNGMSKSNWPENLPELKASVLKKLQAKRGDVPLFANPATQAEMLTKDHSFNKERLNVKTDLKRLLHLEAFGSANGPETIVLTAVGRLVDQKNLGLVADIIDRTLMYHDGAKFIILASAHPGDGVGEALEAEFQRLSVLHPSRVYFNSTFNLPLSKLIFAGGDFCLIPSRFEPCGLVDYEASLLGNIVIGRATGGLTKVRHCAYLYEWLDVSDPAGEAIAFLEQIKAAIDTFRFNPAAHAALIEKAMALDASWDASAAQYINMYRYGQMVKKWQEQRRKVVQTFAKRLGADHELFSEFFIPGEEEYGDGFDWQLKKVL